jgi:hypothetical protein
MSETSARARGLQTEDDRIRLGELIGEKYPKTKGNGAADVAK